MTTAEAHPAEDHPAEDHPAEDHPAEDHDETAGPYPADGSNGPNFLNEEGIVRTDITSSVGSRSGTAVGVPTTLALTVVDAATGSPVPGAAMYLWHCTADGKYSIYEEDDQNYLRGVQVADDSGRVTFTTIFPGCYAGRWPHCHFEVYEGVDAATAGNQAISTSQLALPQAEHLGPQIGEDPGGQRTGPYPCHVEDPNSGERPIPAPRSGCPCGSARRRCGCTAEA